MSYPLLALAGVYLLSGCSSTEVQLLVGPRTNGDYTEVSANLSVVRRLSGRKVCSYVHESEVRNGEPFNDRPEQRSEFFGCGLRWSK